MSFLFDLFAVPPCPAQDRPQVAKMIDDLIRIGQNEGFLSERPGGSFNIQCRNTRARETGKQLHNLGGVKLMDFVMRKLQRPLGQELCSHLEYCWAEIGEWLK